MQMTHDDIVQDLTGFFGDGGNMPTAAQWQRVLELPEDQPLAAINYVKLRQKAKYARGEKEPARPGLEAIMLYSQESGPRVDAVGGHFLLTGLHQGAVIGPKSDWDLAIVGNFPSPKAYLSLFLDPAYREAFRHRRAAVDKWQAVLSTGVTP